MSEQASNIPNMLPDSPYANPAVQADFETAKVRDQHELTAARATGAMALIEETGGDWAQVGERLKQANDAAGTSTEKTRDQEVASMAKEGMTYAYMSGAKDDGPAELARVAATPIKDKIEDAKGGAEWAEQMHLEEKKVA